MLDDIWYRIQDHIRVYTRTNFDTVPAVPGVYSWYYPLRVWTESADEFLADILNALNYDALCKNSPYISHDADLAWTRFSTEMHIAPKITKIESKFTDIWNSIASDDNAFEVLRRTLLSATILMPPLYVGKTNDLRRRLGEHRLTSDFHSRFQEWSAEKELIYKSVDDLVFACIQTSAYENSENDKAKKEVLSVSSNDVASLVEDILKKVARPPYSVK